MNTEMGEYVVGAWLKLIRKCDFIDYNVRRPGGHLSGLNEFDILGLDFKNKTAYLCEATTHLEGLLYKNTETTIERIEKKYANMQQYAIDCLSDFPDRHFMFWSPIVNPKVLLGFQKMQGLEVVVNSGFTAKILELQELAKKVSHDTGNPAFRMLQIIGHLKE